jgi:hypothetical protein
MAFKFKDMRTQMRTPMVVWVIVVMLMPIFLSSCNHPDEEETGTTTTTGTTSAPKGKLFFHLHTYIDNNEVDLYNTNYTTDGGRKMSLQLAQLYLSNIQLVKLDGSVIDIPNRHILMQQDIATYEIGDVSVGNYKSVRFKIGLDPTTNRLPPTQSPDSASLNHPEMWFGTTPQPAGYVFITAKGKIDTSTDANNNASQMQTFEYKIGTDNHYTQINMPDKNYTVYANQIGYLHIIVDYYKLFNGVQLNNPANLSATTVPENAQAPAIIIANNIPFLFRYEE